MQSIRRQANQNIADLNVFAGNDFVAAHCADDGAGKVVLAVTVEARHLGSLAADQSAAVGPARLADALHNLFDHHILELPGCKVIEKEQRCCALHRNVVHAVVHQVLTNGVMNSQIKGDLQLRSHTVSSKPKKRIWKFVQVERKQTAEAA